MIYGGNAISILNYVFEVFLQKVAIVSDDFKVMGSLLHILCTAKQRNHACPDYALFLEEKVMLR